MQSVMEEPNLEAKSKITLFSWKINPYTQTVPHFPEN